MCRHTADNCSCSPHTETQQVELIRTHCSLLCSHDRVRLLISGNPLQEETKVSLVDECWRHELDQRLLDSKLPPHRNCRSRQSLSGQRLPCGVLDARRVKERDFLGMDLLCHPNAFVGGALSTANLELPCGRVRVYLSSVSKFQNFNNMRMNAENEAKTERRKVVWGDREAFPGSNDSTRIAVTVF